MVSQCKTFFRSSLMRCLLVSRPISTAGTVDPKEINVFNNLASQWWSEKGEFKPLHSMNMLRIPFIRNGLANSGKISQEAVNSPQSLAGIKILDVGCGGGILSEPLARIGASVTGLDASAESVEAAKLHAASDPSLENKLRYVHGSLETLAKEDQTEKYDAIVASEVLEHMSSPSQCITLCAAMLKPGGSMFVTTLNRTSLSWLGGIVAAEYVLRIVPSGTHDWNRFITPGELRNIMDKNGCRTHLIHGMAYNLISNTWCWTKGTPINYALHAVKSSQEDPPQET